MFGACILFWKTSRDIVYILSVEILTARPVQVSQDCSGEYHIFSYLQVPTYLRGYILLHIMLQHLEEHPFNVYGRQNRT